jgi:hypothetical protein
MARIPRDANSPDDKHEHVEVLRTGSPEEVGPDEILGEAVVKGDATARNPKTAPEQRKVRRFEVTKGGPYSAPGVGTAGGYRATLREGKVIDEMNYDINAVRAQGIKLNELTE